MASAEPGSLAWVLKKAGVEDPAAVGALRLWSNRIGAEGAKHLSEVLPQLPNLTMLIFYGNNIGDEGATHLSEVLPHCPNLTKLDLGNNGIGDEGAKHLSEVLPQLINLTELILHGNNIGDEGATHLSEVLPHCPNLTGLNLQYNRIGATAAMHLFCASAQNPKLYSVYLDPAPKGSLRWVLEIAGVKDPAAVTELDLGGNDIGTEDAKHLSEVLPHCPNLTALDLRGNRLGDEGATHLSEVLPHCPNLSALLLGRNSIGTKGAKHLSEVLPQLPNLSALLLERNSIGAKGARHLSEALPHCHNLTTLDLGLNFIGDEGAKHLSKVLPRCPNLTKLDLERNRIGDEGAKYLSEVLPHCPNLTTLNLEDNKIDSKAETALRQGFKPFFLFMKTGSEAHWDAAARGDRAALQNTSQLNHRGETPLGFVLLHNSFVPMKEMFTTDPVLLRTAVNRDRDFPLHFAASSGNQDFVRFLVNLGAPVFAKNARKQTAEDLARANGHTETVHLLQQSFRPFASRCGSGLALSDALADPRTVTRVEWHTFRLSGLVGTVFKCVHSLLVVSVGEGEDMRQYILEKSKPIKQVDTLEEIGFRGVHISDWKELAAHAVGMPRRFLDASSLGCAGKRATMRRLYGVATDPYDMGKNLGPYDVGKSNCHHMALAVFNFCAVEDRQVTNMPNKYLTKWALMLQFVGFDVAESNAGGSTVWGAPSLVSDSASGSLSQAMQVRQGALVQRSSLAFSGAAAQIVAGNDALRGPMQRMEDNLHAAAKATEGEDVEVHLEAIESSAREAVEAANGEDLRQRFEEMAEMNALLREENEELRARLETRQKQAEEPVVDPGAIDDATFRKAVFFMLQSMGQRMDQRLQRLEANQHLAISEYRSQTRLLRTLFAVTMNDGSRFPPRILWIHPKPRRRGDVQASDMPSSRLERFQQLASGVKSVLSPKEWLMDTVFVTFVCPVTLKVATCGASGQGFELKQPKKAVKEILPYLKAGLLVLQVAVAAGRALGLPLPNMVDAGERLEVAAREAGAVKELLTACGEMAAEHAPAAAQGLMQDLESLGRAIEPGRIQASRELMDKSARSTLALLEKAGGVDWSSKCGLELVGADDGTVEWVHPSVAEDFKSRGAALVGGEVARVDPSSANRPPLPPPPPPPPPQERSTVHTWLESVKEGFAAKYAAAFEAYGLEDDDMIRRMQDEDISELFQDDVVLQHVEGGKFPPMHRRRLEAAMKKSFEVQSNQGA